MRRSVLLVEARDDSRTTYAQALRTAGLDVVRVRDSHAALEALKGFVPRVLVAGLYPRTREDHLKLCRDIRSQSDTGQIPIVLTTERLQAQDVELATNPGALVLTATQRDAAKLVAAVNGVLAGQRADVLRASLRQPRDSERSA